MSPWCQRDVNAVPWCYPQGVDPTPTHDGHVIQFSHASQRLTHTHSMSYRPFVDGGNSCICLSPNPFSISFSWTHPVWGSADMGSLRCSVLLYALAFSHVRAVPYCRGGAAAVHCGLRSSFGDRAVQWFLCASTQKQDGGGQAPCVVPRPRKALRVDGTDRVGKLWVCPQGASVLGSLFRLS
jgi:hypothetical protein